MNHNVFLGGLAGSLAGPDDALPGRSLFRLWCLDAQGQGVGCGRRGWRGPLRLDEGWPLLTDEQRMTGVEALVGAGLWVIVGTDARNPMRTAEQSP